MLQAGITGGIGAGKSLIARIFTIIDVPLYNADDRAKWLMNNDERLRQNIIDHFGHESYQAGNLNRKYLAEKVFPDAELLNHLNSIVHPAVGEDYQKWIATQKQKRQPYTLKEAALMFETGSFKQLDFTILVHASEKTRITRVLQRDPHRDEKQVREIMLKQMPEEQKLPLADFIIDNDQHKMVIPQVLKIHEIIMQQV